MTRHTDGRGNDTVHTYDGSANRILTVHRDQLAQERWEYNAFGQVTKHVFPSHTDPSGPPLFREDVYAYYDVADGHQNGLLKSVTRDAAGLGLTRSMVYDERGLIVKEFDESGRDEQYIRNQLGQVVRTV